MSLVDSMDLKLTQGWWIPKYDKLLTKKISGKGTQKQLKDPHWVKYEGKMRKYFLNIMPKKRTMIDVGANIGTWSRTMCNRFDNIIAFEPAPQNVIAFKKNLDGYYNVDLIEKGLSDKTQNNVRFYLNNVNCGHIAIKKTDTEDQGDFFANITTLDNFNYKNVDLIKIDVEGDEFKVLKGAEETIKRCRPYIVIEKNPGFLEINRWIKKFGYNIDVSKRAIIYTPDVKII